MTTKSQNMEKSTTIPTILPSSRTCFTKRCHGTDPLPRYVWWEIFFWAPLIKDSCFSKCYMRIGQLIMTRRTGHKSEKYFRSSAFWFVFYLFCLFSGLLSSYCQWSNNDSALIAWMTANLSHDMTEWADHSGKSLFDSHVCLCMFVDVSVLSSFPAG